MSTMKAAVHRGWFGVGISHGKTLQNLGTLWRTAHVLGADFLFTIGHRYVRHATDTTKAWRSVPLWHFADLEAFRAAMPTDAPLIGVELDQRAVPLAEFKHPERAIYLLGAEDHGLTAAERLACHHIVQLPGEMSVNVAVAGSVTLFDRVQKRADGRAA